MNIGGSFTSGRGGLPRSGSQSNVMLFVLDYDAKPLKDHQRYRMEKPLDWSIYPLHVTEELEEIRSCGTEGEQEQWDAGDVRGGDIQPRGEGIHGV